jgi:NhaP-type Na+/H+ or K+/H+ antiporter
MGRGLGELAVWLRSRQRDSSSPNDFLALGLITLSYVTAETLGAWGFLSVFAAGVGLRNAELMVVKRTPHPEASTRGIRETHPPAEELVAARVRQDAVHEPAVAAGVLVAETISFGDTIERLLELLLVALIGVSIVRYWSPQALLLALLFFCVLRPIATRVLLIGTPTTPRQRWLMGWFGVRGIGSVYYLSYALNHGISGAAAQRLSELTLSVIAISVVVHGISAQPLLAYYEKSLAALSRKRHARKSRMPTRSHS